MFFFHVFLCFFSFGFSIDEASDEKDDVFGDGSMDEVDEDDSNSDDDASDYQDVDHQTEMDEHVSALEVEMNQNFAQKMTRII